VIRDSEWSHSDRANRARIAPDRRGFNKVRGSGDRERGFETEPDSGRTDSAKGMGRGREIAKYRGAVG